MNLYEITYKRYNNETRDCSIVAATPLRALEGARALMRKQYIGNNEILSVVKKQAIDKVVK